MKVLVIGAGPAGLGAAEVLAKAGQQVTVVERQGVAGGIPRLCGHSPFGMREFHRVLGGRSYARRLVQAAAAAEILLNHAVTGVDADLTVHLATPDGPKTLTPDRILLATGAREASRAERLLPGERPLGVITTGALQDLWFARKALPFRRPVILGSELVAMSAILTCRSAGARPMAVIENADQMTVGAPYRWLPRALGIPVLTGAEVVDLTATNGRLSGVTVQDAGGQREIDCDGLVLTGCFRPEAGLARMIGLEIDPATLGPRVDQSGRTSRAGIFAAGNVLRGVETAGHCWAEGRAIAQAMLLDSADQPPITLIPGHGLRYVVPQVLTPGARGVGALNIRLDRILHGTLTLTDANGQHLLSLQIASGPERRVSVDLAHLDLSRAQGPVTVEVL